MLNKQEILYETDCKHLSEFDMDKLLTPLKKQEEYSFLNEVSNKSLQITCRDLDKTYKSFYKKIKQGKHISSKNGKLIGKPKFKSKKKSKLSYPLDNEHLYFEDNKIVFIPKLKEVKYKTDFIFPYGTHNKFTNGRITISSNNKYYLSFGMYCENQTINAHNDIKVGIDVGVRNPITVMYKYDNSNKYHILDLPILDKGKLKNIDNRINYYHKQLSRKYSYSYKLYKEYIHSNNILKLEYKAKRLYEKRHNITNNFIHQCTSKIIQLNPYLITSEGLDVNELLTTKLSCNEESHNIHRVIQDMCFYEIFRQLEYKCTWNNITYHKADKEYPSTQECCNCGKINDIGTKKMYKCDKCGIKLDRDYNAAINLLEYEDTNDGIVYIHSRIPRKIHIN